MCKGATMVGSYFTSTTPSGESILHLDAALRYAKGFDLSKELIVSMAVSKAGHDDTKDMFVCGHYEEIHKNRCYSLFENKSGVH